LNGIKDRGLVTSDMGLEKQRIREGVWRSLEEEGVSRFPRPVFGRIPNFQGAERAARRLATTGEFLRSQVVKVNPDAPQSPVRRLILEAGKSLIMPTPRLREGFLLLDPKRIPRSLYRKASTIRGAFQLGVPLSLEDLPPVDLIVCGSVAVTAGGLRIGKGGGYSELEYAILREVGVIEEETPIATTVHDLQIVAEAPREEFDFTLDIIATPTQLLRAVGPRFRPEGVIWDRISEERLRKIPLLRELKKRTRVSGEGGRS